MATALEGEAFATRSLERLLQDLTSTETALNRLTSTSGSAPVLSAFLICASHQDGLPNKALALVTTLNASA